MRQRILFPVTPAAHDALLLLQPPARLVTWLEATFAARERKGDTVPPEFRAWLERWEEVQQGAGLLSVLTDEEWNEIERAVKGE